MKQITKKYIFECRLKGVPIDLTDYKTGEDWEKLIPMLRETGLILESPETNITVIVDKDKNEKWYVQYPVIVQDNNTGPSTWTPDFQ